MEYWERVWTRSDAGIRFTLEVLPPLPNWNTKYLWFFKTRALNQLCTSLMIIVEGEELETEK